MDRGKNPFAPGAGTPPPELVGRDYILENAMVALERVRNGRSEQSMLLVGLRGVGKTVLLVEIKRLAEEKKFKVADIECVENRKDKPSLKKLLSFPLRRILLDLDRGEWVSDKVNKALRVFKSFTATLKQGELEFHLGIDAELGEADSGDLEQDLTSLFIAIAEAAKDRNTAVAIVIDEMQYLEEYELSALIMAIHRISQRSLPLMLVGAGLPQLVGKAGNAKSYAERLFTFPKIDALSKEEAIQALQKPVAQAKVRFDLDALEEIFTQTRGYPYYIQEWGYECWNIATAPTITLENAKMASERAIQKLDDSFFRVRLDRLTPFEKQYVRALAEFELVPQKSGDIAKKLGKVVSKVAPLRATLINKGMIYSPEHGQTAFTVPLFEEFLRREIPKFSAKDEY